jgi:hypothetical protein
MSEANPPAATASVEYPICQRCGGLTHLARIEPDKPGYERRLFERAACGNSETILAKI